MAHQIVSQDWVGPQGRQKLVVRTKNEILVRDDRSGRLAAVTEDYIIWLGHGGNGSPPRSAIRGFYHDPDAITQQYDALAGGQQPMAYQPPQVPGPPVTAVLPPGPLAPPPQIPPQPDVVERMPGAGANHPQPPECGTCPFPDMLAPYGNGHHPNCPNYRQVATAPQQPQQVPPPPGPPVVQAPPPPPPPPPPVIAPRPPVSDELDALCQAIAMTSDSRPLEVMMQDIPFARVAVFEDFVVSGTGKIGNVAVIVWPDGPDHVNTLVRDPRGTWTKIV